MQDITNDLIRIYNEKSSVLACIIDENNRMISAVSQEDFDIESFDEYISNKDDMIEKLSSLEDKTIDILEGIASDTVVNIDMDILERINDIEQKVRESESNVKHVIDGYFNDRRSEVKDGRIVSKAAMNYIKVQNNSSYTDSFYLDQKK